MSTYLAATEVTLLLPAAASITDSSRPISLPEVASWVYEVGAGFDSAAAAAGYGVPLTPSTPAAYAQARDIVRNGVSCRIMRVLGPNVPGSTKGVTIAAEYCKAYEQAMKMLRDGDLTLVDAPSSAGETGRVLPRSFETSNPGATIGGASPMMSTKAVW